MTLRRPAPTTLSHDTVCAVCKRVIPAGEPVQRTRGIGRHNGMWLGSECWGKS